MNFQLSNPVFSPTFKLTHTDKLFFIGSCFADTMSRYFTERKFTTLQNPFGVLYNPVSIANSIEHIASGKIYNEQNFHEHDGLFASWYHHSNLPAASRTALKSKLEKLNEASLLFLQSSNDSPTTFKKKSRILLAQLSKKKSYLYTLFSGK